MKIHLLLAALLLSLTLQAQTARLEVRFDAPCPTQVILFKAVGSQAQPVDTLRPDQHGHLSTRLPLAEPTLYLLRFSPRANDIHLLLHPSDRVELQLAAEGQQMKLLKTKGSRDMELYARFLSLVSTPAQTQGQLDSLRRELNSLLLSHKDCLMAAFLATIFEQDDDFTPHAPLYEALRDALSPRFAAHPFVQHISQKISTLILPGQPAPEIAMRDAEGNIRRLSDLKGQVVLVDFWASWCRPCRGENPNVVRMYEKYKEAGFTVYSVSLDKDKTQWLNAIRQDCLSWPNHVSDLQGWTSSGGATYGITSIPATVLVDRQGNVIARNLRGPDLERKLQEIFGF